MKLVKDRQWLMLEQHYVDGDGNLDYAKFAELYEGVTEKLVKKHYRNFKYAPKKSQKGKRGVAGSAPNKANLLIKARACPTWLAFSEIIDNILDNYRIFASQRIEQGEQPHDLSVKIGVHNTTTPYDLDSEEYQPDACFIKITENSGGITEEGLTNFLSLGSSNWDQVDAAVGVWGNGQKVAMCRLGRHNIVGTRHESDTGDGIYFALGSILKPSVDSDGVIDGGYYSGEDEEPKNYYVEANKHWEVAYDFLAEEDQDNYLHKTVTLLSKVPEPTREDLDDTEDANGYFSRRVLSRLSMIFANKIRENGLKFDRLIKENSSELQVPKMSVVFNHDKMSEEYDVLDINSAVLGENNEADGDFERLAKQFTYIPDSLKPTRGEVVIPKEQISGAKADLRISWLIGMVNTNAPPSRRGFMCWGNGKLFEESHTDINRLLGNFREYSRRPEHSHWKGYLKFWSQDPSLIPWRAPTKWSWDSEGKANKIIGNVISCIASPYWRCSEELYNEGLQALKEYYVYLEDED